jgi:hypothetical protein
MEHGCAAAMEHGCGALKEQEDVSDTTSPRKRPKLHHVEATPENLGDDLHLSDWEPRRLWMKRLRASMHVSPGFQNVGNDAQMILLHGLINLFRDKNITRIFYKSIQRVHRAIAFSRVGRKEARNKLICNLVFCAGPRSCTLVRIFGFLG